MTEMFISKLLNQMRYLITTPTDMPFLTKWFDFENYAPDMVVFDLQENKFTTDGKCWNDIEVDNL